MAAVQSANPYGQGRDEAEVSSPLTPDTEKANSAVELVDDEHAHAPVDSPARLLMETAASAFSYDIDDHADRWPPGISVLLVMAVCGTFWTGVLFSLFN